MNSNPPPFRWDCGALLIAVKVQPRASANQWLGRAGDQFRVRITAPPVDGKANSALREFIATVFGVAVSQVELLKGDNSRIKRLRILAPRLLPEGITTPPPV